MRDCERDGMKLENCPPYVRKRMDREKIERTTNRHCAVRLRSG